MTLEWKDKDISIGSYQFPDKKRPSLCVRKGSQITVYGSFHDTDQADAFMRQLAELIGQKNK